MTAENPERTAGERATCHCGRLIELGDDGLWLHVDGSEHDSPRTGTDQ